MPLLTVTALAEAGAAASFDVAAIMQAAVTSVQADMFKVLGIAVPAAVTIIGAVRAQGNSSKGGSCSPGGEVSGERVCKAERGIPEPPPLR